MAGASPGTLSGGQVSSINRIPAPRQDAYDAHSSSIAARSSVVDPRFIVGSTLVDAVWGTVWPGSRAKICITPK